MISMRLRTSPLASLLFCAILATAPFAVPLAALQDSPEQGSPEPTAESAEAPKNTLKWSTASEVDNFGYDVYRGDQEEGPFARITKDPIPGNGTTDETSKYQFVDADIDPTRDYYYYVESISINGERERFTPVFRAKAKQPLAEDPSADDQDS